MKYKECKHFGEFIKYIEDERYDKAYSLLNESFKNRYFENIEKFIEYAKNKYPKKNIAVNYNENKRYGDLYILTVDISDLINNEFESFTQRIVIRENSANDFKISFQVEEDPPSEGENNTTSDETNEVE